MANLAEQLKEIADQHPKNAVADTTDHIKAIHEIVTHAAKDGLYSTTIILSNVNTATIRKILSELYMAGLRVWIMSESVGIGDAEIKVWWNYGQD